MFISNGIMTDPRYAKLASLLVKYSIELKKNERILLDMIDVPDEFTIQLMRAARQAGAIPLVETATPASPARSCAKPTTPTPPWCARSNCSA
jgi:leucyl aminopeptidase (aminopeptidase T)